jgi:hypothetical protein
MGDQIFAKQPKYSHKGGVRPLPAHAGHGRGCGGVKERQIFFERQRCQLKGFRDLVDNKWDETKTKFLEAAYSLYKWHECVVTLSNFLKGWGRNIRGEYKREREMLMGQIQQIDTGEGSSRADQAKMRAKLEYGLEKLMEMEEIYYERHLGPKWVLVY